MPDCGMLDVGCQVVDSVAQNGFTRIAQYVGQAAADLLATSLTWWVDTPSPNPDSPAVHLAQSYLLPVIGLILLVSVLWQAIQMMLTRRKEPGLNIAVGLVRYVAVAALGLTLVGGAVVASDALAGWLVRAPMQDFSTNLRILLSAAVLTNPALLLLMGILGFLLGLIQWVLLFFRQAGILVLGSVLPLAASGSLNEATKPWLGRIAPWIAGLVCYKPVAALIYAIGFTLIGNARDVSTLLTGLVVIVLACVAMPVMMRFFAFTGLPLGGGTSPASMLAGAAATGAAVGLTLAGGGTAGGGAAGQANFMTMTGPGSQSGGQPALEPGGAAGQLPSGGGAGQLPPGGPGQLPRGGPGQLPPGSGGGAGGGLDGGPGGGAGGDDDGGSGGPGSGASGASGGPGPGGPSGAGAPEGPGPGAGGSAGSAPSPGGSGGGAAGGAAAAGPAGAAAVLGAQAVQSAVQSAVQKAAQAPERLGDEMTGGQPTGGGDQ